MTDIFDAKILCNKCNIEMSKMGMEKNGIKVRAWECPKCHEKIIHPEDKQNLEHFKDLKGKIYSVKLRVIGNSHAISIPKEIVDFMSDMNKMNGDLHKRMRRQFEEMDNMVKLCFEDFGKISLKFGPEMYNEEDESLNHLEHRKKEIDDARALALRRVKAEQHRELENKKKIREKR